LAVVAVSIALFVHARSKPVDAAELLVTVGQLGSEASEGRLLVQSRGAGDVSEQFFRWHAEHLRRKATAMRDALTGADTEADVEEEVKSVVQLAAALAEAFAAASDQRAPLGALVAQFAQLQRRLLAIEGVLMAQTQ